MKKIFLPLFFLLGVVMSAMGQMKIIISGDAMVHLPQISAARNDDGRIDFSPCFRFIGQRWKSADFAIVNFETTISPNGSYCGYPRFSSPREFALALKQAGVDMFLMANNHIMDKGRTGIISTTSYADTLGLLRTGVYAPGEDTTKISVLSHGGVRVAILNYTYSVNGNMVPEDVHVKFIDTLSIRRDITQAKQLAHFVVVVYHWGEEYQLIANGFQMRLASWTRSAGADVIVGSHPHVAQNLGESTVYSLGNLISNQYWDETDVGMSVEIDFAKFLKPRIRPFLHWCDRSSYTVLTLADSVATDNPSVLIKKISATESRIRQAAPLCHNVSR